MRFGLGSDATCSSCPLVSSCELSSRNGHRFDESSKIFDFRDTDGSYRPQACGVGPAPSRRSGACRPIQTGTRHGLSACKTRGRRSRPGTFAPRSRHRDRRRSVSPSSFIGIQANSIGLLVCGTIVVVALPILVRFLLTTSCPSHLHAIEEIDERLHVLQRLPAPLVGDVVDPRLQWALRRPTSPRLASLPRDGLARASRPVVPPR